METAIEYRVVEGFPGYRVGNDGTIWTCLTPTGRGCGEAWLLGETWKIMKPNLNENGYACVRLCREGKRHHRKLHRLVLEAFIGPCPDGMEARHFPDRTPSNCRLENLSWGTKLENAKDREIHGTQVRGSRNGRSRLTDEDVREIRRRSKNGETGISISVHFGVCVASVSQIVNFQSWKHVK